MARFKSSMLKMMKIADIITLMNFIGGFFSILASLQGNFRTAAGLMLFSVLCDYLDGKIARFSKKSNAFGKELDSLADVVSFGITPAVFVYAQGFQTLLAEIIIVFFLCCGILRLARFNVLEVKHYKGMPITFNGILFPLIYILGKFQFYLWAMFLMGALMVSSFTLKKFI